MGKQRQCELCDYRGNKLNLLQVLGQVNSEQNGDNNSDIEFNETMLENERDHVGGNDEIETRQELLDAELKYERVCLIS